MAYYPDFPDDGEMTTETPAPTVAQGQAFLEGWLAGTKMCFGAPLGSVQAITIPVSGIITTLSQPSAVLSPNTGVSDVLDGIAPGNYVKTGTVVALCVASGNTVQVNHASSAASASEKIYLQGSTSWIMYATKRHYLLLLYRGATDGWHEIARGWGNDMSGALTALGAFPVAGGNVGGDVVMLATHTLYSHNHNDVTLTSEDHAMQVGKEEVGTNNLGFGYYGSQPAVQGRDGNGSESDIHLQPLGGDVIIGDDVGGGPAWHPGNDGASSGLDADLLDGLQGSAYLNPAYVCLAERQASGTAGQALTQTTWTKRNVTTEDFDTGSNAALASSVITLEPGTYRCRITCSIAGEATGHRARLRNTTDGTTALASPNATGSAPAVISGRFTIGVAKDFEIQSYVLGASTTTGAALTSGEDEVFTIAEFWKLT